MTRMLSFGRSLSSTSRFEPPMYDDCAMEVATDSSQPTPPSNFKSVQFHSRVDMPITTHLALLSARSAIRLALSLLSLIF